ncbi:MAG: metal ABC transporter permease [Eubacteriales bacterium]|jgi:zinc transport system permease protein|nr:metal ABC transporter permease [Eubacteriales bacterium]MDD4104890.1 metal ABC transporter permease [Eubacteriales bacterium]MDD4710906.1 metal ABC transporter permease [Eubacteriales bacterium]NLO15363.1 metal ABC transporter permease [Clostridiales bacterium]
MSENLAMLKYYFEFPFVRYALIVGVLIALCSSLLGVVLVLKRFSYIGDGLSHVAFGALAIATVLDITDNMLVVLPVTILFAVFLLRGGRKAKIQGDAAIAMLSVGALAVGYILFNLFPPVNGNVSGDVCTTLFGSTSILTLTQNEVWLSMVLSGVVVVLFVLFYHRVFAVTFDENFAEATGQNTGLYNMIIAVVIATVVALAMKLVGSLLISALLIFPAISAMRVFRSFLSVVICAAALSVVCAALGIIVSILAGTPVGSTIVAADILGFFVFSLLGTAKGRVPA